MELHKSNDGKHKYYIIYQGKKISFGAKNYMDYTLYYKKYGKEIADKKKAAYIARHSKSNEDWGKTGNFQKVFIVGGYYGIYQQLNNHLMILKNVFFSRQNNI